MEGLEFYNHNILRKSHILKFETGKHMSNRSFEYAHATLWGSTRAQTHCK